MGTVTLILLPPTLVSSRCVTERQPLPAQVPQLWKMRWVVPGAAVALRQLLPGKCLL